MTSYIHLVHADETLAINATNIKGFQVHRNEAGWALILIWDGPAVTVAHSTEANGRALLDEMLTKITNSLAAMGERGGTITINSETRIINAAGPRSTPQLSRY